MELLLQERMIVESVARNKKSLNQIRLDTSLDLGVIKALSEELVQKGIILFIDEKYCLNREGSTSWLKEINSISKTKNEIKEIFNASVELMEKDNSISLKKVHLTEYEEKLLSIELKRVENFITEIQKERRGIRAKNRTKDMKVVYWGYSNYGEIVQEDLKSI